MAESPNHLSQKAPIRIEYAPQTLHRSLPVEVIDRSSVLARKFESEMAIRQRVGFHILMVCTAGRGTHVVDFEPVELSAGSLLRIYPGQVQSWVLDPVFEAIMVVWPAEVHPADPSEPAWYPGSEASTYWHFESSLFAKVVGWIEELRYEQDRFDGSRRKIELMESLLRSLILRLAIKAPDSTPDRSQLPEPYLAFRTRIETCLYVRPTVGDLASELGYSSRTLDRACDQVTGKTAKQVLDERIGLELRRLLTHTDRTVANIAADFAFDDPSNFSKFVKRHLGELPGKVRNSF